MAQPLFAQLDNTYLSDRIRLEPQDSNRWGLSLNSFNYLRNTEYFNDIELGRTLFGYQLQPSLFIQPNDHLKLQAGVFLQSDFGGQPAYTKILPTFSVKLTGFNHKAAFIFGTLEGALAHRLIEPLFDISSAIEKRVENGAQITYNSEGKQFTDIWINWEQFIERGSPFKERFTAGISNLSTLYRSENGFYIALPLQFKAYHKGGQIDADTSNMTMQLNGAAGLKAGKTQQGFINEWGVEGYYTLYRENSNSGYFPYRNGSGVFANGFIRKQAFTLAASYWQGKKWIAPGGTAIYQSVSTDKPGFTEKERALVFVRLIWQKPLAANLNISTRFEPVYDLHSQVFDFSYSLYLSFRLHKNLGRLGL